MVHTPHPSRIFVYCHDTYGMGNARRMMAISTHLARVFPRANLLLASGSPVIHGFRLPDRLDYIKLPSVARTDRECYASRYLTTGIADTMRLRSSLLKTAVADFAPDLVLVDKKPLGLMDELADAQRFMRSHMKGTKQVLVLRDILDAPAETIPYLARSHFERSVNRYYDRVVVLGSPDVFDMAREYRLSSDTAARVTLCGYVRAPRSVRQPADVRIECGVAVGDRFVLVTPGGGEDSGPLLDAAVDALVRLIATSGIGGPRIRALIVAGPQTAPDRLERIQATTAQIDGLTAREFTDDMASYMTAADLVVSMGGYNTVCEVLSLAARAIVVPRCRPVQEQRIRAERMAGLGLFRSMPQETLAARTLADAIREELEKPSQLPARSTQLNLNGLQTLTGVVTSLMREQPGGTLSAPVPRLASVAARGPA